MQYKEDEVVAFYGDQGMVVCKECMTADEMKDIEQDEIITEKDVEEDYWFCDRCKKSIN